MKTLITIIMLVSAPPLLAQHKVSPDAVAIRTNAVCDMCKKTIETELVYEKGVKAVELDLARNLILVDFDTKKTDLAHIERAIAALGYAANDLSPDTAARKNLPECCRKEGCGLPVKEP